MALKNLLVVNRETFNNFGKSPLFVLVRDREYKTRLRTPGGSSPTFPGNDYPQYDRLDEGTDPRQTPVSSPGLSNQTYEFDANSSEYEFNDDGYEEFWISTDAIVGNSTRLANGDITGSTGAKRDLLVNGSMPVDCRPFTGPQFPVLTQPSTPVPSGEYRAPAEDLIHGFMYTQIIKVYDNTAPVVTGLRDTFCTSPTACTANITKVVTIKDNCTNEVKLEQRQLMIAPNQTTDAGLMILYSTPRWSTKACLLYTSRCV